MKKNCKRLLSMLLMGAMIIGLFPVSGFAVEGAAVAQVGSTQYDSLQDAINNAGSNGTVELLTDVVLDGNLQTEGTALLQVDGTLTIEGNNHTISATASNAVGNVVNVVEDANVTMKNIVIDGGNEKTAYIIGAYGATLTLEDVELKNSSQYDLQSSGSTLIVNGAKAPGGFWVNSGSNLTVNDGDLGVIQFTKSESSDPASTAVINGGYMVGFGESGLGTNGSATDTSLTINGGYFDQVSGKSNKTAIDLGAQEYQKYLGTGVTLEKIVFSELEYSGGTSEFYYYHAASPSQVNVAEINGKQYESIMDAVYAAQDGETIELLSNVEIGNAHNMLAISAGNTSIGAKKVIIDGNNHTISSKYAYNRDQYLLTTSKDATPEKEKNANLTIKNVTFDGAVNGVSLMKGFDVSGTDLTLENVVIQNMVGSGLEIKGSNIQLTDVTVKNTGGYAVKTSGNTKLTVDGLTTEGNTSGGIEMSSSIDESTLTINDATISEDTSILLMKQGQNDAAKISASIIDGSYESISIINPEAVDLEITGGSFKNNSSFNIANYLPDGYVFDTTASSDGYGQVVQEGDQPTTPPEEEENLEVILGNTTLKEDTYYQVDTDGEITESTAISYNVYYKDHKLVLNNLNYSGEGHSVKYGVAALSTNDGITCELIGNNKIVNTENYTTPGAYGVYIDGDFTVTGEGNLTIEAPDAMKDGDSTNMLPTGTVGLHVNEGSLIVNGAGTITAIGGNMNAEYVQSYGITVFTQRTGDGGDIIVNGTGIVKGMGGSGDGTHAKNFTYGIDANRIMITSGGTVEGIGGTAPDRGGEEQYQDSSSMGIGVAYVDADNGTIKATGGNAQRSWGFYTESGFLRDGSENKLELTNNSTLVATANGNRTSIGMYSTVHEKDTTIIKDSSLIADSGKDTAAQSIFAIYDTWIDERINKDELMWRYEKDGSYITGEDIITGGIQDKLGEPYFEIRDLDPEKVDPGTSEEPDTPSTPSEPSTPSQPSEPEQPAPDVTTDEDTSTTTTTAKPDVTTSDTTASATVSEAMGEAIVEQATENESNTVVIAPEMDSDITEAEVVVPAGTVEALGDDTDADLVIDTPVGKVTLPNSELSALAKDTDDITVSLKADGDTVEFVIADDAGAVATVNGGVKLVVPADAKAGTVAVIVNADGTREVVRKSVASGDNMIIPLDGSATIEIVENSKDFVDVAANSWYSDAVAFASSHELFNGTSATEFSPDAGMTRGMLAAVLSNLERGDGSGLDAAFNDVADDAWYAEAIAWAAENGIVNGLGNGMFGPEELITREQMAAMLYNYADMLGVDTSARANLNAYSDADSVSSWANEVMSWANATGIINGTTTTTLDPQGTATRAQVAAMLERFVLLIAE